MKYDFTTLIDRTGKDALACEEIPYAGAQIDPGFDRIPMWVADMSFPTVPTIPAAIIERAAHPNYGYFNLSEEYFSSIIRWHKERNGVEGLLPEHIGYENSVMGGVMTALSVLCSPGDNILLHSPAYNYFSISLQNHGYNMIFSPLVQDENDVWRMDFADMEAKIIENKIHTVLFCSPHNPSGRVWEAEELQQFLDLCQKHDVYVISDEIWSDLILQGHKHIPLQSISEEAKRRVIAMYAPSKTFNLAGLVGSYHIVYNKRLRDKMEKVGSLSCYNNVNIFSMHGLIGAYRDEGMEWLDELRSVLSANATYAYQFIKENFPGVKATKPQGTYLLYLDCSEYLQQSGKTLDEVLLAGIACGVIWLDGRPFKGENTIRLNLALPFHRMQEAFDRLKKYVFIA